MNKQPLLSIICTVYNQGVYIQKCLDSVSGLDYPNWELFIVDNGSQDNSRKIIEDWVNHHASEFHIKSIFRKSTWPYCKSFNEVLAMTSGKYLIDLSGDDILLPGHAMKSVEALEAQSDAAVCFSDAYLSKNGTRKSFYKRDRGGQLKKPVQAGDIYEVLVASHHVLSVTMVLRTETLKVVGGYDESLSYEDFDIQVRLARRHPFVFSDHFGVIKTLHPRAMSMAQYQRYHSVMLPSTLKICQKIKDMNQSASENAALIKRLGYELKHSLFSANFAVAKGFLDLANELGASGSSFYFYRQWLKFRWDLSRLYDFLKKLDD